MPFIINCNKYVGTPTPTWDELDYEDFKYFQSLFGRRHTGLAACAAIDYIMESKGFEISEGAVTALKREIPINQGKYFVAQFMCNEKGLASNPDFAELRLGFCIKTRRKNKGKQDPIKVVIDKDSSGKNLTRAGLKKGVSNFLGRKRFIFDDHENELFESDRLGRAHLIDEDLINFFSTTTKLYAYFIIDNQGLSIAFSQEEDVDKEWLEIVKAYDHGTACCPIG
jgi:hypothetical protein